MNLMIDLETLGTKPGCAIMEIGAVLFDVSVKKCLYKKICLKSNILCGMDFDLETIAWWKKQTAKEVLNGRDDITLPGALQLFKEFPSNYLKTPSIESGWNNIKVWANGSCSDVMWLEEAFNRCNIKIPWTYKDPRDTRTLWSSVWGEKFYFKEKAEQAEKELKELDVNFRTWIPVKHKSIDDALIQAQMVIMAQRDLSKKIS